MIELQVIDETDSRVEEEIEDNEAKEYMERLAQVASEEEEVDRGARVVVEECSW